MGEPPHHSVRSYLETPVSEDQLNAIILAGQSGPTSINGQQISVIVTRDPAKKASISQIAGGQPWISTAPVFLTVVMDFHKTKLGVELAGKEQLITTSQEALIVGAVDAGIALSRMMICAQSLGLGVVPIGGIRNDPSAMISLLNLPLLCFPLVGLTLGHIKNDSAIRPRMDLASFRHEESYHQDNLGQYIRKYDQMLEEHWRIHGRNDGETWSSSIAKYYSHVYFRRVRPVLEQQGFSGKE